MSEEGPVLVFSFLKDRETSPEKQAELENESVMSKSSKISAINSENLSVFSSGDQERREPSQYVDPQDELNTLQSQLWSLSQQEYYNETKGLPKHLISQIKRMKIGKVKKACSICHNDFIKDEKIMKLPCGHIFHYKCVKTWLKISIFCPLCRLNLKELLEAKRD